MPEQRVTRLGPSLLVQPIGTEGIVIRDEETDQEVLLDRDQARHVVAVIVRLLTAQSVAAAVDGRYLD